jgi:hypothetical protein
LELRLEIEERLLHLVLALQVDEKHVDQSPALSLNASRWMGRRILGGAWLCGGPVF